MPMLRNREAESARSENLKPRASNGLVAWGIRILLALAILFTLLAALAALPVRAQFAAWSPPLRLSPPGSGASFPDVLADGAGTRHVAWSSSDELFDIVMYTTLAQGAPLWAEPVDVVANRHNPGNYYVARPALTINENWQLAMGVHAPDDTLYINTAPAQLALDPFAWTNNQLTSPGYHSVPLASGGLLHVVYTQAAQSSGCQACLHLFYVNSADNGISWSNPIDVGRRSDRGAAKPQFIAGSDGAMHLVWESGLDGDRGYVIGAVRAMYAASYDNGANWSPPVELDNIPPEAFEDEIGARNIALTEAGDGSLVAAWWQMPEDLIYYRTSKDGGRTWADQRTIPSVWGVGRLSRTRQDNFAMVTDSSGMVHLFMMGRLGQMDATVALLHLSYLGGSWSFPRGVANYDKDLPEWPRAAVALGNQLHVVWHVRPGGLKPSPEETNWEVWESHLVLPSAALPAVAAPPVAPIRHDEATPVAATPTPARPTPVIMPAAERAKPAAPVSMQTLMSENDDVGLLMLALIPAALLVVAGLLWQRRRARR